MLTPGGDDPEMSFGEPRRRSSRTFGTIIIILTVLILIVCLVAVFYHYHYLPVHCPTDAVLSAALSSRSFFQANRKVRRAVSEAILAGLERGQASKECLMSLAAAREEALNTYITTNIYSPNMFSRCKSLDSGSFPCAHMGNLLCAPRTSCWDRLYGSNQNMRNYGGPRQYQRPNMPLVDYQGQMSHMNPQFQASSSKKLNPKSRKNHRKNLIKGKKIGFSKDKASQAPNYAGVKSVSKNFMPTNLAPQELLPPWLPQNTNNKLQLPNSNSVPVYVSANYHEVIQAQSMPEASPVGNQPNVTPNNPTSFSSTTNTGVGGGVNQQYSGQALNTGMSAPPNTGVGSGINQQYSGQALNTGMSAPPNTGVGSGINQQYSVQTLNTGLPLPPNTGVGGVFNQQYSRQALNPGLATAAASDHVGHMMFSNTGYQNYYPRTSPLLSAIPKIGAGIAYHEISQTVDGINSKNPSYISYGNPSGALYNNARGSLEPGRATVKFPAPKKQTIDPAVTSYEDLKGRPYKMGSLRSTGPYDATAQFKTNAPLNQTPPAGHGQQTQIASRQTANMPGNYGLSGLNGWGSITPGSNPPITTGESTIGNRGPGHVFPVTSHTEVYMSPNFDIS